MIARFQDKIEQSKKFWIVWRLDGGMPTVPQVSVQAAYTEAKRLAGLHIGKTFVVLEAVTAVTRLDPIQTINLKTSDDDEEDEFPF